jgi:hypothetical protein
MKTFLGSETVSGTAEISGFCMMAPVRVLIPWAKKIKR